MIAAGEAGGILDTILKRLATYIEKAVKLAGQVKSAMVYPVAVIVIAGVVVGVILWKVIPTFASLFAGLGAELPLPTRVVIALSDNLVRFFPFVVVIAGAAAYAFKQVLLDPERPARRGRDDAQDASARADHAQDRRRAILPHAGDAHQLRRADSRRPRNHRQDSGERDCRRRGDAHAQEHRARRDRRGAAQGHRRVPVDGHADDRRRRGDGRTGYDARQDCGLL